MSDTDTNSTSSTFDLTVDEIMNRLGHRVEEVEFRRSLGDAEFVTTIRLRGEVAPASRAS